MVNKFTIEQVRNFWDSVADQYEPTNQQLGYVHTQRFERAIGYADLRPAMRVLNIWSRTGNIVPYLPSGVLVEHREVSPRMISLARKRYPDSHFELTDLTNLSEFTDNSFDRIISLETLEHTPEPSRFLKELHRILKPGGVLVMSLPPKGAEISLKIYELFFTNHGEGPHTFLWPSEVKTLFINAGFTFKAHHPFIILPLGSDSLTRWGERILTGIFGKTFFANLGIRHFYIATK